MKLNKCIASFFGIGLIGKGGGTIAACVTCLLIYFATYLEAGTDVVLLIAFLVTLISGVYSASVVERSWGKDSKQVVIDEVMGMITSLLFLPINYFSLGIGLCLFRFFDIVKPFGIRHLEKLKGGWGVMADDLLAGIYANLGVRLIIYIMAGYYE
jgi:phosphatidylglycerophosphatase A